MADSRLPRISEEHLTELVLTHEHRDVLDRRSEQHLGFNRLQRDVGEAGFRQHGSERRPVA